ncbi:SGNH/GDSL hydrolase family protein [Polystyrenella longa]|uniref:hypothetical protein n=1 Tax=Polystyrenella longa TaxID=2528007 RepID=UPI0011A53BF1|nr:hypothetical protein [Polystyrenella longa]
MSVESNQGKPNEAHSEQVIVLGASNVAISLSRLVHSIRKSIPAERPLNLLIAGGHGRSYGMTSRVLARSLPGIRNCGIWDALETIRQQEPRNSSLRPKALLTDVGNDLIYGVAVERLVGWVETCLERLQKYQADIVMTGIPLQSLARLSPLRYTMTQKMFFPTNSSEHGKMVGQATELNEQLELLAEKYHAAFEPQPGDWFGFDPIHFRGRQRPFIWQKLCQHWSEFDAERTDWKSNPFQTAQSWRWKPAQRGLFGKSQTTHQPCFEDQQMKLYLY